MVIDHTEYKKEKARREGVKGKGKSSGPCNRGFSLGQMTDKEQKECFENQAQPRATSSIPAYDTFFNPLFQRKARNLHMTLGCGIIKFGKRAIPLIDKESTANSGMPSGPITTRHPACTPTSDKAVRKENLKVQSISHSQIIPRKQKRCNMQYAPRCTTHMYPLFMIDALCI